MKCLRCGIYEEYTNRLCMGCYLKTVPPGKVIEYNPKGYNPIIWACCGCNQIFNHKNFCHIDFDGKRYCAKCEEHKIVASVSKPDPVSHPSHYTQGGIETISFIRAKLTKDEFVGYCMGNVLKYTTRYKHKNGVEDLKKAQTYLTWAIERMEQND